MRCVSVCGVNGRERLVRGTELRLDRDIAALAARLEYDTADDRRVHLLDEEDLLAKIALQALANLGAQVVVERHRRRHRDAHDVVVFLGHGMVDLGHLRQQIELPALHERTQHSEHFGLVELSTSRSRRFSKTRPSVLPASSRDRAYVSRTFISLRLVGIQATRFLDVALDEATLLAILVEGLLDDLGRHGNREVRNRGRSLGVERVALVLGRTLRLGMMPRPPCGPQR